MRAEEDGVGGNSTKVPVGLTTAIGLGAVSGVEFLNKTLDKF